MTVRKKISLVVPFFNECDSVFAFYDAVFPVFEQAPNVEFEVVCIDDGSTDGTLAKLIEIVCKDSRFSVLELSRNFGKEAALTAGIDAANGDAVVPMDADLQDPPTLILDMIKAWEHGAEVVLARRIDRSSDTFLKKNTAKAFYRLYNKFSSISIPENVGDFRLMDRIVVNAIKRLPEHHRFMKGLFAWVGFKSVIIDYSRSQRVSGVTKFSGLKLWNFALEGITGFGATPLKVWSYVGAVGAVVMIAYSIFIIFRTLVFGVDIPGYASLLVTVLLFGSLQLISVGMLGEYIGRIYMETKHRPLYLVRKIHTRIAE